MDFNLFITIFTILFALFPDAYAQDTKIVGGVDAGPNEFPYQISLRWNFRRIIFKRDEDHLCGGSILTEDWILTAAHCNVKWVSLFGILEAMAGEIDFDKEDNNDSHKQVRTISQVYVHEKYETNAAKLNPYDIAVGRLSSPFVLNQFVSVINLPVPDSVPTGSTILSGWGSVSKTATNIMPRILQKAEMSIIDLTECKAFYGDNAIVDDSNVCAGDLSGEPTGCVGDSGGPLVQLVLGIAEQVGIVSFGAYPCSQPNRPGVFTKVSFYIDWINTKINS